MPLNLKRLSLGLEGITGSKYPPGVEEILQRAPSKVTSHRHGKNDESKAEKSRVRLGNEEKYLSATQCRGDAILPMQHQNSVSVSLASCSRTSTESSQKFAIRVLSLHAGQFAEIRRTFCKTLHEYHYNAITIFLCNRPWFLLNKTLKKLEQDLRLLERCCDSRTAKSSDVEEMIRQIQPAMISISQEGFRILNIWNRREGGKEMGQPLIGKERTMRKLLIHEMNAELKVLSQNAKALRKLIRNQHIASMRVLASANRR